VIITDPATAIVGPSPAATAPGPVATEGPSAVLVGAGDIAVCGQDGDEQTAALLDAIPGTVFTVGDNVYDVGTEHEFRECYQPSWGRHKDRTRPAPGNHDYGTPGAAGYFAYFGAAAGDPSRGYYSYDLGAWHLIALNSNCGQVGGCGRATRQGQWLQADLAANPTACTLVYWHHPRFSSGPHGSSGSTRVLWDILYEAGADVILNGHDHLYERFMPQTPNGLPDPVRGIRQFTVGTGGARLYGIAFPLATSEVREAQSLGVLKLTLRPDSYEWEFIPVAGQTFTDAGSDRCH
jgi:hypothetical protein